MHRPDAPTRQPTDAVTVLIVNVAGSVHRCRLRRPGPRSQSPLDASFAPRHVLMSTRLHSKCPSWCQSFWLAPRNSDLRYGHFELFVYTPTRKRACTGARVQISCRACCVTHCALG